MTEIPEHLRKRAEAARQKAEAAKAAGDGGDAAAAAAPAAADAAGRGVRGRQQDPRAPARARRRRPRPARPAATAEADGGGGVGAAAPAGGGRGRHRGTASGRHRPGRPHPAPAHRRQVRLDPGREGHAAATRSTCGRTCSPSSSSPRWPCTAFVLIFSIFVNAPLLELANVNQTPNPSKAPWYFLGLQELLTMFHPMVAGVTIPGMGIFLLILAPYIDKQPVQQARGPQVRHLALHHLPHVLGRARHHRLVLPGPRLQLRRSRGPTASSSSCDR